MEDGDFQFPPSDWRVGDANLDAYNFDSDSPTMYDPSLYDFEEDEVPERIPFLQSMQECTLPILRSVFGFTVPLVAGGFLCSTIAVLALRLFPRRPRLAYLIADLFNACSGPVANAIRFYSIIVVKLL